MTDNYFRSLRGPLLLMTLGILMMLDHRDKIGIGDSWPILLMVFGLMILLERLFTARQSGVIDGGPHS
jgi:hypothetical protein